MRRKFTTAVLATLLVLTATLSQVHADVPPATPILGAYQHQRAQKRFKALAPAEATRFRNLLSGAKSMEEKRYLEKAFAVGHPLRDLEDFGTLIRGRDRTWLRDNLRLSNNSRGTGIQQLWNDACGPTTALAALGELDPLFAVRYRKSKQAALQKTLLERPYTNGNKGGVAMPRGQKGGGRWIEDILTAEKKKTGIAYEIRRLDESYNMNRALGELDAALNWGVPVPVVAKSNSGSHYCLVLSYRKANDQKLYTIHDPWTGCSVVRTDANFRQGRLDLAGNNVLDAFSMPMW